MNKRKKILIIVLILLLIAAIGVIIWLALRNGKNPAADNTPQNAASQSTSSQNDGLVVPERPEMLDVVAFEALELKADTLEQSVRFDNPLENNCWLVITLSLEDGTLLWESEELIPGEAVRNITLNQPLAAGKYENAVLSYKHWTYDEEKLPLNGAETLVTLNVQ